METDRAEAIRELLVRAEAAHGAYESSELGGRYDEEWPRWYAQWAVDNGLADLLGREIGVDETTSVLASTWDELQASSATPAEDWGALAADRLSRSS